MFCLSFFSNLQERDPAVQDGRKNSVVCLFSHGTQANGAVWGLGRGAAGWGAAGGKKSVLR